MKARLKVDLPVTICSTSHEIWEAVCAACYTVYDSKHGLGLLCGKPRHTHTS